jgi:DNA-binding CsgD family transcriptional regulator
MMDWELPETADEASSPETLKYKRFKFSLVMFNYGLSKALLYFSTKHPDGNGKGEFLLFEQISKFDKKEKLWDTSYMMIESITVWETHPQKSNTERKKTRPVRKNRTSGLSTVLIGDPSLTQNMIGHILSEKGFDIVKAVPLQDGCKLLKTIDMPSMLVIMVDRGIKALELIRDIETMCGKRQSRAPFYENIPQPSMLLWSEYDNYTHVIGGLNFNLWRSTSAYFSQGWREGRQAPRSFIGKEESAGELIMAIEKTAEGTGYLAPRLAKKIRKLSPIVNKELTERESDIFGYVQLGFSNDDIANRLGIKKHSVENVFMSICEKMGAGSREELFWL